MSNSLDESQVRARMHGLSFVLDCGGGAEAVVDAFVDLAEIVEAADGDVLLREGDVRGTFGFILLDGRVTIQKSENTPVAIQAPALIGEMQQFSISGSRSASVCAQGACILARFDWPDFYAALEQRLRPLDFQRVKDAIRRYSWNHALDADDS